MRKNNTPHDAVFKQFLTHKETAKDFLQLHLPAAILKKCDLETLKLESGNFVEEDLRAYYSDVLYSLKTANQDSYIYCLIEHQSSPDKHMAFRLMRYAIAAMQRHLDAGHDKLPLVVPLLFYHGLATPYPYSMNWLAGFAEQALAREVYSGDFPLIDITVIPDDEIMQHRSVALLELLQKHIRRRDLNDLLEPLVTLLRADYTTVQQLIALINYMLQVGDTRMPEAFIRELARRAPKHEEVLMTIAQKLEQKGRQEGIQEGRQEGRQEGIQKGIEQGLAQGRKETTLALARQLLLNGVERQVIKRATGLSDQVLDAL